jgi:hypothetical protein
MIDSRTPAPRPLPRRLSVVITSVAVILLLASCSGTPSSVNQPSAPSTNASGSAVAYSACMRSHGVQDFPDPGSAGQLPKADPHQLGVSTVRYHAAQRSCQHLVPVNGDTGEQQQELQCATGGDCSQAVIEQWMNGLQTLAACLRTHGEPNWPDPIIGPGGTPHFPYQQAGIDHHSSRVLSQVDSCVRRTGFEGLPLP